MREEILAPSPAATGVNRAVHSWSKGRLSVYAVLPLFLPRAMSFEFTSAAGRFPVQAAQVPKPREKWHPEDM